MSREHPTPRYNLIIFGAIAVLYCALAIYFAGQGGAYWTPEQGSNRIATEYATQLYKFNFSIHYPGQYLDATFRYFPFGTSTYYLADAKPFFPGSPLFWLINQPLVAVLNNFGAFLLPGLSGLACLWLLAVLLREFIPEQTIWAGLLLAGLATPLLIYSLSYSEHTLAVALLLAGMVPLLKPTYKADWKVWVVSALACGLAAVLRKESLCVIAPLALLVWLRHPMHRKQWLFWLGIVALLLGMEAFLNYLNFGWPIPLEYFFTLRQMQPLGSYMLRVALTSLIRMTLDADSIGMTVLLLTAMIVYGTSNYLPRRRLEEFLKVLALAVFCVGLAVVIFTMPLDAGLNGFLSVSPFLLLAFIYQPAAERSFRDYYFLVAGAIILLLVTRSGLILFSPAREGLQWGSRHMLAAFLLSVPLATAWFKTLWEYAKQSWLARMHFVVALGLGVMGIIIQMRGLSLIQTQLNEHEAQTRAFVSAAEEQIVTNQPLLAVSLPELYGNKEVFLVLKRGRTLYKWIETANAMGIQNFIYVSDYQVSNRDLSFLSPEGRKLSVIETHPLGEALYLTRFAIEPVLNQTAVIDLQPIASGLINPTYLAALNDGLDRLFVLERPGRIRVIEDNLLLPEPFLDITDLVASDEGERSFISMAFDPDYKKSGRFWVSYSTKDDLIIARYTVSSDRNRANPDSAQIILQVPHPGNVHFGGQLQFGPEGYLYISTGDGGYDDTTPSLNGQRLNVLLGKLLRIDVSGSTYEVPPDNPFVGQPDARPEIWAYGLRNPWRFSFDRQTDDLYIADVGESDIEEINLQPAGSSGGQNYGWHIFEGTKQIRDGSNLDITFPIFEVSHQVGFCAIIGGYVYRGSDLPQLTGAYLFTDYCTGQIWALEQTSSDGWMAKKLFDAPFQITSFGEDASGEIYILDVDGVVYRLAAPVQ